MRAVCPGPTTSATGTSVTGIVNGTRTPTPTATTHTRGSTNGLQPVPGTHHRVSAEAGNTPNQMTRISQAKKSIKLIIII